MSRTPHWRRRADRAIDEHIFKAILASMTTLELEHPHVITGARAARIARGSGRSLREVRFVVKALVNAPASAATGRVLLAQAKRRLGRRQHDKVLITTDQSQRQDGE